MFAGVPVVYKLDKDLKSNKHFYLASVEPAAIDIDKVLLTTRCRDLLNRSVILHPTSDLQIPPNVTQL